MPIINDLLKNDLFKCFTNTSTKSNHFTHVYTTDLISMVIKHAKNEPILITQICAEATLAVAIMLNLPAIILTEDHFFSEQLITRANDEQIAVITTSLTASDAIIVLHEMDLI